MRNPLLPRVAAVVALGIVSSLVLRGGGCFERPLRVGTFNVRELGKAPTNMDRLAELVASTGSDVLALQEVMRVGAAADLAKRLEVRTGRRFVHAVSQCGGRSEMRVGYLYDAARVTLISTTEYPELAPEPGGRCGTERSGLAAKLERRDGRAPFQLLTVHFVMGGDQVAKRREQWRKAHVIAAKLGEESPVAILGDANSTGFLDDDEGERTFILDEAKKADLDVLTTDAKCTEYWRPKRGAPLTPSLLDHVVATPRLVRRGSVKVHGFCADLRCRATATDPPDFTNVSDHCPVTIDL
ncbi:MAG: endonuclease/exonuclease/phosphatase family protein [Labilithrix sp.]|nr:endonuclease/exonuclease/phosphatase family protein [Labilithrix sp.]MCW5816241.1 endonuclease/exonuclease/phosphatase family protein [Labilithrix sp.]